MGVKAVGAEEEFAVSSSSTLWLQSKAIMYLSFLLFITLLPFQLLLNPLDNG